MPAVTFTLNTLPTGGAKILRFEPRDAPWINTDGEVVTPDGFQRSYPRGIAHSEMLDQGAWRVRIGTQWYPFDVPNGGGDLATLIAWGIPSGTPTSTLTAAVESFGAAWLASFTDTTLAEKVSATGTVRTAVDDRIRTVGDANYAPRWQPNTAYAINDPVFLPNGTTGKRTAAGTSRATFDATELAAWTVASGTTTVDGLTDATTVGKAVVKAADAAEARSALGAAALATSVVTVPPAASNAAVDTAAIQAAHDALPAGGGEIRLRAGIYYLTATGVTFTKRVKLVGVGGFGADSSAVTQLFCNSATAQAITITATGCGIEGVTVVNNGSVTPTAGWGVKFSAGQYVHMSRVYVFNFYDNVRFETGNYWTIRDCVLAAPVRYGLFIQNTDNADSGDGLVQGCRFVIAGGPRNAADAAVRWVSGGGARIIACKVNGNSTQKFVTGFDFALIDGATTADLFVHNNSLENISGSAVRMIRQGATGTVTIALIESNEFMSVGKCVELGAGTRNALVQGNVGFGATVGVDVAAGGPFTIGTNHWRAVTTPVNLAAGVSAYTTVSRQDIEGTGIAFTDGTGGLAGAQVDYRYKRAINWAVSGTPTALWTLGVPNYGGGIITVHVTGTHTGVGGFVVRRRVAYTIDGGGVVTLADMETVRHGSTQVNLAVTVAANQIVIALSTDNGTTTPHAVAALDCDGKLTQLKVGA